MASPEFFRYGGDMEDMENRYGRPNKIDMKKLIRRYANLSITPTVASTPHLCERASV